MAPIMDIYESLDVIGTGSFGIIRKVRRKADGMVFARKELDYQRMSDRDKKQIVAEVNILKDLHHEHIVRYHDRHIDHDAGTLYILMEYCGGGDLSAVLKQAQRQNRPIPEDTVWNYFMQLLLALNYCHHPAHSRTSNAGLPDGKERRPQILHRDLKPDNVFLDENGAVKLGDFGLSKALQQASFANTYVGTPYYMSPELMQEKAYDTKSDIWSLGCLVYELCALKPPFHEAKTHAELSILIRNGRIPPLPKGYSPAMTGVIKAMLNLNPAMRPSATQLLGHERVELAFKVSETQKLLNQVKTHKTALQTREREIMTREAAIAEKELAATAKTTQLTALLAQKDAELDSLRVLTGTFETTLQTRVRDAVVARDEELRALLLKQEAEVAARMARREEEIMEAVRSREEEIGRMWAEWERKTREAMQRALEERMEWVEREAEEVRRERERLEEIKQDLARKMTAVEEGSSKGTTKATKALQEVKNIMASARFVDSPEPVRVSSKGPASIPETPTPPTPSPVLKHLVPPSAMKGVILTSTGQTIATPSPAELAKLFVATPKVRLNFAQVFEYDSEADIESADSETDDGEEDEEATCKQTPERNLDDDKTPQPSPAAPPTRLRRPSIVRASASRPNLKADPTPKRPVRSKSTTRPAASRASSSASTASSERSTASTSSATNGAGLAAKPAPTYDLSDEENLPSPFIKRTDSRLARTASAPAPAGLAAVPSAEVSKGVAFPRNAPRKSGVTLRAVAVVNAAKEKEGRPSIGAARSAPSRTASASTASAATRSSVLRAQKASEEARKALVRT